MAMMTPTPFPPMTTIEEYPLHGWDYGGEYACQRPEDDLCHVYDWRCHACVLAAQAHLAVRGDSEVMWRQSANHEEVPVMKSWLIERALWWHREAPV